MPHITLVRQEIRVDPGRRHRVAGLQENVALRMGPQQADMAGIAIAKVQLAGVVIDDTDHEMRL